MAGISTPSSATVKQIDDITECPICNEVFIDPRILPCVHTFCFECIAKWAEDQGQATGSRLTCPLCRKELEIPGDIRISGIEQVASLPKNFFVQKLINTRKLSDALSATDVHCDVCCGDSDDDTDEETGPAKFAVAYCVECSQNVCKQCYVCHRKMKISSQHKLLELRDDHSLHNELLCDLPENHCDKHASKILKLYCHDCRLPACTVCLATDHQLHKFSDVKQLSDGMRIQMKADIANVTIKVDKCRQLLAKLEAASPNLSKNIEATAKLVTDTAEKMKQAIDDYKFKLLSELESATMQHEKKIESMRQELQASMQLLETFKHYSEQVANRGTASDVVMLATCLRSRANELIGYKISGGFPLECLLNVKFSSEFATDKLCYLFGELHTEDMSTACRADKNVLYSTELLGVIPSKTYKAVTGITSLGDDVFVVCHNAQNIDVYNAITLELKGSLPTLRRYKAVECSLAACDRNKCIYVSLLIQSLICRIDPILNDDRLTKCWPTAKGPIGLSVNRNANLLVTCRDARKIQEFTTNGLLIREISIQSDVTCRPMNAVQLTDDQLGVILIGPMHRFCIVGSDGRIVRGYNGGAPRLDDKRLLFPHGIAPTACGDAVFVADKDNSRILLLNLDTLSAVPLHCDNLLRETGSKLKFPYSIHYDQSRGRLYIGEHGGRCRVLIVAVTE